MNSWIQRNIIFPKISQHYQLPLNARSKHPDAHSPVRHSLQKKASFVCLPKHSQGRKNYSIHIRNLDPFIINSTRGDSPQQPSVEMQQLGINSAVKRRLAILELLDDGPNMFHSRSPRTIPTKLKLRREEASHRAEKVVEMDYLHMEKPIAAKKTPVVKLKTEPVQVSLFSERHSQIRQQRNECLSIRKATTFDYNELAKGEEEREGKRRRYSKARQGQRLKETGLKITSIRGWNHEQDAHLIPQYSYAW